jgi:hypothetical protein
MPTLVGGEDGEAIQPIDTEYGGRQPLPNAVQSLGPDQGRKLTNAEKLRLGYLTGQEEDPDAPRETGFMGGVDSHFPEHPELQDAIPEDYRSEDYLE